MPDMFKLTENYLVSGNRLQMLDQISRHGGDLEIRYHDGLIRTVKESELTPVGRKILLGNT